MDQSQEKFYDFIVQRVREECVLAAKDLLKDNFAKQTNGVFSREDMVNTQKALVKMLKPEAVEEVRAVMAQFSAQNS
jgi:predicted RND superfamily exporter protein